MTWNVPFGHVKNSSKRLAIRPDETMWEHGMMRISTLAWLVALGLGCQVVGWAGEPPEQQLDCRVYETRQQGIGLALSVAYFIFNVGPQVSWTTQRGVAWDQVAQGLIARYVEVCTRYNAGIVTKGEYDQRVREIDGLYLKAQALEAKVREEVIRRSEREQDKLDQELAKRRPSSTSQAAGDTQVDQEVNDLKEKIDRIEPIDPAQMPNSPCVPSSMGKASGAKC